MVLASSCMWMEYFRILMQVPGNEVSDVWKMVSGLCMTIPLTIIPVPRMEYWTCPTTLSYCHSVRLFIHLVFFYVCFSVKKSLTWRKATSTSCDTDRLQSSSPLVRFPWYECVMWPCMCASIDGHRLMKLILSFPVKPICPYIEFCISHLLSPIFWFYIFSCHCGIGIGPSFGFYLEFLIEWSFCQIVTL